MLSDLLTPQFVAARSDGALEDDDPRLPVRIDEAIALAYQLAPCLQYDGVTNTLPEHKFTLAAGILGDAIVRLLKRKDSTVDERYEAQQAGPFGLTVDTRQREGLPLLTRAETAQIDGLCSSRVRSILLRVC